MSWRTLTYFGDSMLLIPTAAIIALLLLWKSDNRRAAGYWVAVFGLTGLIVSLSKLAFMGWGIGNQRLDFTGFSGHTAMAATLWPVMFWLVGGGFSAAVRGSLIALGYALAVLVGVSRLTLNAHSDSEVLAGLLLGLVLSSAFLLSQRHTRLRSFTLVQLAAAMLLPLLLVSQGKTAKTQYLLQQLSLQVSGRDRPWKRTDMGQAARPEADAAPARQ
ncbi:phosphatase PAP2 family protein [Pantoea sp. 1.19]|uniref:phosphatase PAP2 family protein n=1 Tax=Pantoea sp. 1.19 TaxID=1925589 RepID=UPI0009490B7B|nr:phosphatase PAP2 family protein [Pantoea sp. 1.19]